MKEAKVKYALELDDKFIIENVPVRLCEEADTRFFRPETVEGRGSRADRLRTLNAETNGRNASR